MNASLELAASSSSRQAGKISMDGTRSTLGLHVAPMGSGAMFEWRDVQDSDRKGLTIWSISPQDTKNFGSSNSALMINYRVEDLEALLKAPEAEGVEIDPHREDGD